MPYAFIQDIPADAYTYGQVRARMADTPPAGLLSHVVYEREEGLRFVDVWESEEAWRAFHDSTLMPILSSVLSDNGLTPDPSKVIREQVTVVDTWVQAPAHLPVA
ncbi:MAG TPA: hypothetical protein VFJ17_09080 [Mycobacteriales bacterium]|jgi:hypothetical protein|nr:hypothetical protein [Mycobacteriales bacterium]